MDSPKPVPPYSCGENRGVNRIRTEMTQRGHTLAALLGALLCPTVTCSLICVVGPLFSNIALGDFESATFVVGEFVSVRLALASRVKGRVVERVSEEFAVTEVGSVYDGSRLEELRVGGVGLLRFAGGMLARSIRAGATDMLPNFVFFPVAVDEGLLEMLV